MLLYMKSKCIQFTIPMIGCLYKKKIIVDDHSRVILTNRQPDYINANYIDVSITLFNTNG